jgi:hypothetical protein
MNFIKIYNSLCDRGQNRIKNLSEDDKKKRLSKNLHSDKVDHIARGKAISKSKKEKTNQSNITSERLGKMNDVEFTKYLESISHRMHTRAINFRNKWKNISQ